MHIVPVLDLKKGCVVRGVAGKRDDYRPIKSCLTESSNPVDVAQALQSLGLSQFYLADLDAIGGDEPCWGIYRDLAAGGIALWIDAGIDDLRKAKRLFHFAQDVPLVTGVIAGLESLDGPDTLEQIVDHDRDQRLIFSLDLKNGRPIAKGSWSGWPADKIANAAVQSGVRRMIVLDLAGVGVGSGVVTLDVCRRLRERNPHVEIISGGGVRDRHDLELLAAAGCTAALVASALHDGTIKKIGGILN